MKKILVFLVVMTFLMSFVAANTIESSTMVFEGALTDNGDGSYSGTIAMVSDDSLGSPSPGFDVFAKNGAWATYDKNGSGSQDYAEGQVTDHDVYTTAGGWGTFYNPDVSDWYNYQLRFESGKWYVEYNADIGYETNATGPSAAPMSGSMNWNSMYATEEDKGVYYSSMGSAETADKASDFATSHSQSIAGAWDMDWSWGSEYVPLEYLGFRVEIENISGGNYRVTMVPADDNPENQETNGTLEDFHWSISITPTILQFGSIPRGSSITDPAENGPINVDASGSETLSDNVYVTVDVIGEDAGFYNSLLELYNSVDLTSYTNIAAISFLTIPEHGSRNYQARLHGDTSNLEAGPKSATIVYTAYGEPL